MNLAYAVSWPKWLQENPTPGGGSAAALAGALGASLCAMVARLTEGREKYRDAWAKMSALCTRADDAAARLLELMVLDSRAYESVMAAMKMPKGTDREKSERGLRNPDRTGGSRPDPSQNPPRRCPNMCSGGRSPPTRQPQLPDRRRHGRLVDQGRGRRRLFTMYVSTWADLTMKK